MIRVPGGASGGAAEEAREHPENVAVAIAKVFRDSETCSRLTISLSSLVPGCIYMCQARLWDEIGIENIYTDSEIIVNEERMGMIEMDLGSPSMPTSRLWGNVRIWDANTISGIEIDDALLTSMSVSLHPCKPRKSPAELQSSLLKERNLSTGEER